MSDADEFTITLSIDGMYYQEAKRLRELATGKNKEYVEKLSRVKQLLPHAEGPHLVTGRHFLQEDSGYEIAGLIRSFLDRLDQRGG